MSEQVHLPFIPVKGTQNEIETLLDRGKINDGYLYFALDTKKIFYGQNQKLIPMGGSSSVHYSNYDSLDPILENAIFNDPEHFNDGTVIEDLNIDDLILNSTGVFYRVTSKVINPNGTISYDCLRLTVAGSGGSGGGSGTTRVITSFKWFQSIIKEYNILGKSNLKIALDWSIKTIEDNILSDYDYTVTFVQGSSLTDNFADIQQTSDNTLSFNLAENGSKTFDLSAFIPQSLMSDTTLPIFCYMQIDDGQEGYTTPIITFKVTYKVIDCNWNYITKEKYSTKTDVLNGENAVWNFNYVFNDRATYRHYFKLFLNNQPIYESPIIYPEETTKEIQTAEIVNLNSYINTLNSVELEIYASADSDDKAEGYVLVSNNLKGHVLFYSEIAEFSVIGTSLTNFSYSQYELITIPIIIYNPNSEVGYSFVQMLDADGNELANKKVNNLTWENFYYNATTAGNAIKLKFNIPGQTSVEYFFNIKELDLGIWSAVENSTDTNYNQSLILNFNPKNFSGNEGFLNYCPENNKQIIFSENFDFNNGGYKVENALVNGVETQYTFFRVCAGDRITIPTSVFTNNNGLCFKIIFRALNCEKFDAVWGEIKNSNILDRKYLELKANSIDLSSLSKRDFSQDIQYVPNEIIEFEFDVANSNKNIFGTTTQKEQEIFSLTWINGTPYSVIGALGNHPSLPGANEIILGSDDCDIDIFLIKGYNTYLPLKEHLQNYIADSLTAPQLAQRLERNNILTDLSSNNLGRILDIDISKLITYNKNCIVHEYIVPYVPTVKLKYEDKATRSIKGNCTKNCVYKQYRWGEKLVDENIVNFGYEISNPFLIHPDCDIGVQGTSSMDYIISAANLDTNFAYSSFANSKNELLTANSDDYAFMNDRETFVINKGKASPSDKQGPKLYNYYKMSSSSMGCNYMNTKVNVASAENANNVCLAWWYQKFNPYISPVRKMNTTDNRNQHRDTLEFTNGLLFFIDTNKNTDAKDTDNKPADSLNNVFKEYESYMDKITAEPNSTSSSVEQLFNMDNKVYPQFYGICNFGNSKKNTDIFHRSDELCMEIKKQDVNYEVTGKIYSQFFNEIEDSILKNKNTGWGSDDFIDGQFEFRYNKSVFIDPNDDKISYKLTEISSDDRNLLINLDFNNIFHLNQKYGNDFSKTYTLIRDLGDSSLDYYQLTEVFPHETYNWKIYDDFSYWARLVNWFAHNNPYKVPSLEELETLSNEEKEIYALESQETYLKSNSLLSSDLNPWIVNTLNINTIFKNDEDSVIFDYDCKERRILKMFEECESFISLDSLVYHYLFIEKHSLVDNAAKNTFWSTTLDSGYLIWDICKDYDNDTASGNDNTGHLSIDFGHENTDVGSEKILNGNGTKEDGHSMSGITNPWLNFISSLNEILARGYRDRRYAYDQAANEEEQTYLDYVSSWQESIPEICWIADCYRKYLRPVFVYGNRDSAGDTSNTEFLDKLEGGKKMFQRIYFEKYQTEYLDSKYLYKGIPTAIQQDNHMNKMEFRGQMKASGNGKYVICMSPYHKGYLCISNSTNARNGIQIKATNINQEYFLEFTDTQYDQSQSDDGYISIFYPENIRQLGSATDPNGLFGYFKPKSKSYEFGSFPNLSQLYINTKDEPISETYTNPSLTFSDQNTLLKKVVAKHMHKTLNNDIISVTALELLTRLKELDLTSSDYQEIQIAPGAMLETLKVKSLTKLTLDSLTHYVFKNEDVESFSNLEILQINNIDTNYQNSLPLLKRVLSDQSTINKLYESEFSYTNFQWNLLPTDINTTTNKIEILDKLLQIFSNTLSSKISGTISITQTSDPYNLYNYYVLNRQLYQLDFQFTNNNLYNFVIKDYENNSIWEKRFINKNNLLDSTFYENGMYNNKSGIRNWEDIKTSVLHRQSDSRNTYSLSSLTIKIGNSTYEITNSSTIEDLLNNNIQLYQVLNSCFNTNHIDTINNNIEIIPNFTATLLYVPVTIYISRKNGQPDDPHTYSIQLESGINEIIDTITDIPYYTDNEEDNKMYLWQGLSLSPNANEPLPENYQIETTTILYAMFTEEAKDVGQLTWSNSLLNLYKRKNLLVVADASDDRKILMNLNRNYTYKGKVLLCPHDNIQFSYITATDNYNILGEDCTSGEEEVSSLDKGITHLLFIKNFSPFKENTQYDNAGWNSFVINQFAFMNLTSLKYINLDNLNITIREDKMRRRITLGNKAFQNCNLTLNTLNGYKCITFNSDYTFSNAFNSNITALIIKDILSFSNSGYLFIQKTNQIKNIDLDLTTLMKGLSSKDVLAEQDLSTLFGYEDQLNNKIEFKSLNSFTLRITKNSILNNLSDVISRLSLTSTFNLTSDEINAITTEEQLYNILAVKMGETYLSADYYLNQSHTDTEYIYNMNLI